MVHTFEMATGRVLEQETTGPVVAQRYEAEMTLALQPIGVEKAGPKTARDEVGILDLAEMIRSL